ncbi:hypothetical protein [Sulfolobus acidocaldarius]|uniref:Uncharacterized protein n=4 Tax=Sulfolobus acidocaldarius TaxID=2285 RepID=A0A0U3F9T9_9CREN|nr:hypothetical protein [Sulfolobus acidocaldarius]AAY81265.1 hypothetical membrane protein [Sulfolobus acidocaldarius DSM 639]AGE71895.1 hypothetical protein SacN8_09690 [Sulfolobus acidocaldarius N8]AGE74168.1 hypothetical protein SacRon12I_09715 [Sulfolobus acidocaldarius Ron12/I]ALU29930.1 hypothetical protein ATY89_08260 [Sulfolobus acidocaldarius]ALU32673.1 hypothetical protein ATZ20_11280 [Sulfolobus acidocaldarius]
MKSWIVKEIKINGLSYFGPLIFTVLPIAERIYKISLNSYIMINYLILVIFLSFICTYLVLSNLFNGIMYTLTYTVGISPKEIILTRLFLFSTIPVLPIAMALWMTSSLTTLAKFIIQIYILVLMSTIIGIIFKNDIIALIMDFIISALGLSVKINFLFPFLSGQLNPLSGIIVVLLLALTIYLLSNVELQKVERV